jgi:hypothetical protein
MSSPSCVHVHNMLSTKQHCCQSPCCDWHNIWWLCNKHTTVYTEDKSKPFLPLLLNGWIETLQMHNRLAFAKTQYSFFEEKKLLFSHQLIWLWGIFHLEDELFVEHDNMVQAFIGKIRNTPQSQCDTHQRQHCCCHCFWQHQPCCGCCLVGAVVTCMRIVSYSVGSGIFAAVIVFVGGAVACMCITISVGSSVFKFPEKVVKSVTSATRRLIGNRGHHCRTDILLMFV